MKTFIGSYRLLYMTLLTRSLYQICFKMKYEI